MLKLSDIAEGQCCPAVLLPRKFYFNAVLVILCLDTVITSFAAEFLDGLILCIATCPS